MPMVSSSIPETPVLKLSMEGVEDEIAYWNLSVVAYAIGVNPHVKAFEGFFEFGKNLI